jgi:hypothetical protein
MKNWIALALLLSSISITVTTVNAEPPRPQCDGPNQALNLPPPSHQIVVPQPGGGIDTAPIPGRPGSPGPGLPGGPGDPQGDQLVTQLFYDQDKIDGKAIGPTLRDEYPSVQIETLHFVKQPDDGGNPVYKKDGAILFGKGRYAVKQAELPKILMIKNGQTVYTGSNQDLSLPNIEKLIKDTLHLDPTKPMEPKQQ